MDRVGLKDFLIEIGADTSWGKKLIREGKFSLLLYKYQQEEQNLESWFDDPFNFDDMLYQINSILGTDFKDYFREIDRAQYIPVAIGEEGTESYIDTEYGEKYIAVGSTSILEDRVILFDSEQAAKDFIDKVLRKRVDRIGFTEKVKDFKVFKLDNALKSNITLPFVKTKLGFYENAYDCIINCSDRVFDELIGSLYWPAGA